MGGIIVLYHSQEHGNTAAMAEAVAEGARGAGAEVTCVNTNESRLDIELFRAADGIAAGTPDYYSYMAGGIKMFLDDWYIANRKDTTGLNGKPYALFFSHGGGGKVKGPFEKLFSRIGEKVGGTVESVGAPDAAVLARCRELGRHLTGAC